MTSVGVEAQLAAAGGPPELVSRVDPHAAQTPVTADATSAAPNRDNMAAA